MDQIAREAGYSKATLYVYFKNKEEIVGYLVLESMRKLYDYLSFALDNQENMRKRYEGMCRALVQYQEEFPLYFGMAIDEINIDFEKSECLEEEKETYRIGEKINEKMKMFLNEGIKNGEFRNDIEIMSTIFSFWGMLSGLIQAASNKETYINKNMNLSKYDFLRYGFEMLYRSVLNEPSEMSDERGVGR